MEKNSYKKIVILENNLLINGKQIAPVYAVKSINISYNTDQFASGYTVYLNFFLKPADLVIKKRLNKNEADYIACEIAKFLDKQICYT